MRKAPDLSGAFVVQPDGTASAARETPVVTPSSHREARPRTHASNEVTGARTRPSNERAGAVAGTTDEGTRTQWADLPAGGMGRVAAAEASEWAGGCAGRELDAADDRAGTPAAGSEGPDGADGPAP